MPNKPNGYAGPYRAADGWWHCYVTVGEDANGRPKRKHVRRRTQMACAEEVARVRRDIRSHRDTRSGELSSQRTITVGYWLDHWLETVVKPSRRWKTYAAYEPIVRLHLKPRLGSWRLTGTRKLLQPEHVEACWGELREQGMAPSYVLQCHRVLSRALKVAVRRGQATRNVCDPEFMDAPSLGRRKPKALPLESVKRVLTVIAEDPMDARWLLALLLGLRQGEALGLRWRDVDLDAATPVVRVERQAQRRTWRHGCADPVACARKHCRKTPCRPPCSRHKSARGCPPLCPEGCTGHARACPDRTGGGMVFVDLKSEGSERRLPLDAMLVRQLRAHRETQRQLRAELGLRAPGPDDLVFAGPFGTAIDPRRDHEAWERLLERAGVEDAPLHAARHSAATALVATGTDISVVQELLGHTDIRMTRGYTDVAAELKREAVDRLAAVLFGSSLDALVQQSGATFQQK